MGKSSAFRVLLTLALITGFSATGAAVAAVAVDCTVEPGMIECPEAPSGVVPPAEVPATPDPPATETPSDPEPDPGAPATPEEEQPQGPAESPAPPAQPGTPAGPPAGDPSSGGSAGGSAPVGEAPSGTSGGSSPSGPSSPSGSSNSSNSSRSSSSSRNSSDPASSTSEPALTAAPAVPVAPQGPVLTQVEVRAATKALEEARETLPTSVQPNARLLAGNTSSSGALMPSPDDAGLLALIVAMAVASIGCAVSAGLLRKRSRPRHVARG